MEKNSYKDQIVYQIYPRSFSDSQSDGVGDIKGIVDKLDYLKDLGITTIWLSPIFSSPMEDGGYDIADYYHVDPLFGTDEDLDLLLKESKKRGLKILLDLVVNHTSDKHHWFLEAKKSKDNPYHDYYVWREKPNALKSTFGGSAWEYNAETNEYYLHLFAKGQPDLNWQNPALRNDIYKMMNYWLDKGVYGFRMDVIENIGKDPDNLITANGPTLHPILQEMAASTFAKKDSMTVGETWCSNAETRVLYTDPKRHELNMVFLFDDFSHFENPKYGKWVRKPFVMKELREIIFHRQMVEQEKSWDTLYWNNHDLPRALNRYIDLKYRDEGAKMLLAANLFMRGTPFIYQGDEIGMVNGSFRSKEEYRDIETLNAYDELKSKGLDNKSIEKAIREVSRDNARVPMQWSSKAHFGFSNGQPWLKCSDDGIAWTVEEETKNPRSVLSFYKKALLIWKDRQFRDLLKDGEFIPQYEESDCLWSYRRIHEGKTLEVIANFSNQTQKLPKIEGQIILHNYDYRLSDSLRPYEAIVIYKD